MTKDKHTDEESGIELSKYIEESAYQLPSIVFEFTSQRSATAEVRIVQTLPEELDPEHVGFHKEEGQENWRVREEELVFENRLDEKYKTIIALRPDASADIEDLVSAPHELTVEQVETAMVQSASDGRFTRSSSPDTQQNSDALEQDLGEEIPTLGNDGLSSPSVSTPIRDQLTEEEESVVDRFVSELKKGTVSEESLDYLQQEFGTQNTKPSSVDARISDLQNEVSDLRAYTGALEAFLDKHGSAEEIIDQFEKRLASFEDELASFESTVTRHDEKLRSMHDKQQEFESKIDSHSDQLSSIVADMEDITSDIDEMDEQLPEYDIPARISDLEEDIREATEFIDGMRQAFKN